MVSLEFVQMAGTFQRRLRRPRRGAIATRSGRVLVTRTADATARRCSPRTRRTLRTRTNTRSTISSDRRRLQTLLISCKQAS